MTLNCKPFGRPASPNNALRDPGNEVVNDVVKVCTFIFLHPGRLGGEGKKDTSIVEESFHDGSSL